MSWGLILGLAKNKWTWILAACGVLFIVSFTQIVAYGNRRYEEGLKTERAVWQTVIAEGVAERNRLGRELRASQARNDALSQDLTRARNLALAQAQEETRNAQTVEEIVIITNSHRDGLRTRTSTDLARARADYLSSLSTGGDRQPTPAGPVDVVPDADRGGPVRRFEGSMVGECLGQR